MTEELNYVVLPEALIEDLAAKNDVRYYLNYPYLDLRGDKPMLVATNGHLLAAAPVEVCGDVEQGPLPIEAIKRVRKAASANLYFKYGMCGTGKVMFEREFMDCKYPEWQNIIPKTSIKGEPDVTFDARYFKAMQDALAPGAKISQAGIALFLQRDKQGKIDPHAAIRVRSKHDDIVAVIMPMRF